MISVRNDTDQPITVTYCGDPSHSPECAGELQRVVPPGSIFSYDQAADNGSDITAQLAAATEIVL